MTQRRVEVQLSPEVTFTRLYEAFMRVGKVEDASTATRTLTGKARHGFNPVRLRISVLSAPSPDAAVVEIQARGQDVWGVASRKIIDRLIAALG